MTVSLEGLHPVLMRPRVEALLADPEALALHLYVASAFRSIERQTALWNAALLKYGDPEKADDWVARPGESNHGPKVEGYGTAVDLAIPGVHADARGHWPPEIRADVDAIASRHGLQSPMQWEDWHYEPIPDWHAPAAPTTAPVAADEEDDMALAKDRGDQQVAKIRELYWTYLGRGPDTVENVLMWCQIMDERGLDAVVIGIADSPEGLAYAAAKDKLLGIAR